MKRWVVPTVAAVLCAAFAAGHTLPGIHGYSALVVSDTTQLLAPLLASLCCANAARLADRQHRTAWWLLCGGTLAWAAGQAQWTFIETLLHASVPFPSWADFGFVAFPLLAAAGLVTWTARRTTLTARTRDVLDGAIIAGSLLELSWVGVLHQVLAQSSGGPLAVVLSLLYPVGDVVLSSLVLIALARSASTGRFALGVLGAGLVGLSAADSAYVYMAATDSYSSTDWVTGGWVLGFCLVAVAAAVDVRRHPAAHGRMQATEPAGAPTMLGLSLPYLPLTVALTVAVRDVFVEPTPPRVVVGIAVGLVVLVLLRQFLALVDNRHLVLRLRDVHDQLHHQALHDPLTGLPNRTLFGERLDRALLSREHDIAVFFCDIDDFKAVNDAHGHEAGDVLLRQVADRLLGCVRETDTVARLGGDEFAILVVESVDAREMGERVVEAVATPYALGAAEASVSISVGIAEHHSVVPGVRTRRLHDRRFARSSALFGEAERENVARSLLTRADTAMYAAKRGGKGRAVLVTPGDEHGLVGNLELGDADPPRSDLA